MAPWSSPEDMRAFERYLVAGGVAGMVARTAIAPVERVKILYQISKDTTTRSWWEVLGSIIRTEGVAAFWKGNSAAIVRVVPYMSITFVGFEEYKQSLQPLLPGYSPSVLNLLSGSCAGLTAVSLTFPLDVVRARLAMQAHGISHTSYTGILDCMHKTAAQEGVGALYKGMGAAMVGVAPYAGIKFCTYEFGKSTACQWLGHTEETLPAQVRVSCGAVAGLLAQTLVYPCDVVRRRMQTHFGRSSPYRSTLDGLITIARDEGVSRGLYRGLTLNYIKTLPN
eukprot:CAMPEP_0117683894 /NCGR_PEP_ID=MMETSP0804-20121206/20727_1 /TAXON_ID=1074897 /ORGANISM="Tetraselmis astigmatica, Strain CCMP880" /LENGTH=280 /DNA_ID=CAMNT_0005494685 /DNA_START=17 /DNA_END=856 /DNA_ORIENTATION=+